MTVEAVNERKGVLREKVDLERKERYKIYKQKLTESLGRGAKKAMAERATDTGPLKILAEGDSWFEYPLEEGGIIDHLEDLLGVPICNMAHHGDEVRQMMGLSQRKELMKRLSDKSLHFDALLFSGGGNDLVGDQFCIWLKDYFKGATAKDLIHMNRLNSVLGVVEAGYRDLIRMRDDLSLETKIFFHGYDFAMPTGKKACLSGPWLKPSLEGRSIEDKMLQFEVVKVMLQAFADMLTKVANQSTNVFHVSTQGQLQPTAEWWANEIHPSPKGFWKMAEVFKMALQAQFPQLG